MTRPTSNAKSAKSAQPVQPGGPSRQSAPPQPPEASGSDLPIRDTLADPGSYQSNHATTGYGSDDDHADPDDAKVQGRSRD
jgi:hypothetical protein